MREIKFRLYDTERKMMAEYLNCSICIDGSGVQSFNSDGEIEGTELNKYLIPLQYTGLKDKNGKEIYEGDIVKHHNGVDDRINKVSYVNGCFVVCSVETPNRNLYLLETYYSFVEVIGNIYENPKLLKE